MLASRDAFDSFLSAKCTSISKKKILPRTPPNSARRESMLDADRYYKLYSIHIHIAVHINDPRKSLERSCRFLYDSRMRDFQEIDTTEIRAKLGVDQNQM